MEPPEEHIHAHSTGAIAALEELQRNSHRCKDRHFFAAARKQNYHRWCGIPTILINSFIAYVLIRLEVLGVAGSTALLPMSTLVILTIFLGFIAAFLSAIQTIYNFQKVADGHSAIANRYLAITRGAQNLIRRHSDLGLNPTELWAKIKGLEQKYEEINTEAAAFPTSAGDYAQTAKKEEEAPN